MDGDGFQMARFFVERIDADAGFVNIPESEARHAKKVLRIKPGERITIFDGASNEYAAELTGYSKTGASARIIERIYGRAEPGIKITLFQSIPKSDKMDSVIRKCTELGVVRFVPVATDRSVVRFSNHEEKVRKAERWRRIAIEASKQCGGSRVPQVDIPAGFEQAVEIGRELDACLMPHEKELGRRIRSELSQITPCPKNIGVFIGPEGGFAEKEIEYAVSAGIRSVTLGGRILRTETAGIVVASILLYEYGYI